ncbi:hypothetical protein C8R43DRAFT_629519 [Mycena crocata]|nr:hypothetical protein C8R43DRAFT_629519 [Mycena crocata]
MSMRARTFSYWTNSVTFPVPRNEGQCVECGASPPPFFTVCFFIFLFETEFVCGACCPVCVACFPASSRPAARKYPTDGANTCLRRGHPSAFIPPAGPHFLEVLCCSGLLAEQPACFDAATLPFRTLGSVATASPSLIPGAYLCRCGRHLFLSCRREKIEKKTKAVSFRGKRNYRRALALAGIAATSMSADTFSENYVRWMYISVIV